MPSLPRLTLPDLVADSTLINRLVHEGETLFVERKERDPKVGLGATVASFANTLGGWLLIGVDDDGNVVGYEPPGRADLPDYVRDVLRGQVNPLPPFAAVTVPVGELTIGVVRVAESSDTPHITREGVIYVGNPGGKQRVTDHHDIVALARRGELARADAEQRLYGLPMIADAMRTPDRIYGDDPTRLDELGPLAEVLVRATPYTVGSVFADRALSSPLVERAKQVAVSLLAQVPSDSSASSSPGGACPMLRRISPAVDSACTSSSISARSRIAKTVRACCFASPSSTAGSRRRGGVRHEMRHDSAPTAS